MHDFASLHDVASQVDLGPWTEERYEATCRRWGEKFAAGRRRIGYLLAGCGDIALAAGQRQTTRC